MHSSNVILDVPRFRKILSALLAPHLLHPLKRNASTLSAFDCFQTFPQRSLVPKVPGYVRHSRQFAPPTFLGGGVRLIPNAVNIYADKYRIPKPFHVKYELE